MQNQKLVLPANVQKSVGLPTPKTGVPIVGATITEYTGLIKLWALDRNLIEGSSFSKQSSKLLEEVGEMSLHINKGKPVVDDIGDIIVVITILCAIVGLDVENYIPKTILEPSELEMDKDQLLAMINLGCSSLAVCQFQNNLEGSVRGMGHVIAGLFEALEAMAEKYGVDVRDCLEEAYNEIKDRKGRMIDGKFVKEADLPVAAKDQLEVELNA